MAIDYTSTYELLVAVERMFRPTTLFRDTFFNREVTFASEAVLMDYRKGSRKMAPFVSRNGGSVNVDRTGFTTKQYIPPMMAPSRVTSIGDITRRGLANQSFRPAHRKPANRNWQLVTLRN